MVELIVVMVLIGVIAAVGTPRLMGDSATAVSGFAFQVASALRYAQKSAVGHRRLVCASLGATSVALQIASGEGAQACDATLALPVGAGFSSPDARVTLSAPVAAATLYFQPDGTITSDAAGAVPVARTVLTVSAPTLPARTVTLSGTTGYVD